MAKTVTSPLVSAFNNIAAFNSRTKRELPEMQREYTSFDLLIKRETNQLNSIELPKKRKLNDISNLNISNLFGSPGNLLGGLFSGALDIAGFLTSMYPSNGTPGKPQKPRGKPGIPKLKGSKIKFGPLRSIGILNSIFTGLDFATGLQEGESVGKAAAGAGGSLAASLLGGVIGQGLIPIPGLGFVVGSTIGGFLGGYGADRLYESTIEQKQEQRLKQQEFEQKESVKENLGSNIMSRFDDLVSKFTNFVSGFGLGIPSNIGPDTETDLDMSRDVDTQSGDYPGFDNVERVAPFVTGHVSTYDGAQYGAPRKGGRVHAGQDIAGQKAGDPVLAAMSGIVDEVGRGYAFQKGGGESQTIGIKHKDGSVTRYVHVLSNVSVGDEVKAGQKIGTVSPADKASSPDFPHLHFELYAPGSKGAMDPRPFLKSAPSSPSIAPIKKSSKQKTGPDQQTMKFGAIDIESAPSIVVGDSIADGIKDQSKSSGSTEIGATPFQVYNMIKNQQLSGKLLKLSSGISNDTSQLDMVRKQIELAKSKGAKGIQLMGTSVDRNDLAVMNSKLKDIASEFPGFVQFTGGFNSNDRIHPRSYKEYLNKMNALLKQGMGGIGVDPSKLSSNMLSSNSVSHYPSYSKPGSTTIIPITIPSKPQSSNNVIAPASNNGTPKLLPMKQSDSQTSNALMKKIFLTNLNDT